MSTILFGIVQILALVAVIYGAVLTLGSRPHFWERVAAILAHIMEWARIFDQAVELADLARRNPYAAARISRQRLEQENLPGSGRLDHPQDPRDSGLSPFVGDAA